MPTYYRIKFRRSRSNRFDTGRVPEIRGTLWIRPCDVGVADPLETRFFPLVLPCQISSNHTSVIS